MVVVVSGTVTAGIPVNGVVTTTFTNTTSTTDLVSKILVITNPLGIILDTVNMGSSDAATYDVTSDQWLLFTLTIVDSYGTSIGTFSYVSDAFYNYQFPQSIAAIISDCDTFGKIYNLSRAELYKNAAITQGLFGQGVQSNALIIQANFYLMTPYYAS